MCCALCCCVTCFACTTCYCLLFVHNSVVFLLASLSSSCLATTITTIVTTIQTRRNATRRGLVLRTPDEREDRTHYQYHLSTVPVLVPVPVRSHCEYSYCRYHTNRWELQTQTATTVRIHTILVVYSCYATYKYRTDIRFRIDIPSDILDDSIRSFFCFSLTARYYYYRSYSRRRDSVKIITTVRTRTYYLTGSNEFSARS